MAPSVSLRDVDEDHAVDAESQPLGMASKAVTPLPKLQLTILCLVRLAEPIAYTQIFPYVNRMMETLHVTDNHSNIGFYSGLVESSFAFAQLLTIFQWAKLSDTIGRTPVILCGLFGAALTTCLFGFSHSLAWALLARGLAGGLAGNAAVIQSMVGEITDETNQSTAYPLLSLCWNLGCIIGPLIGGSLSEPAKRYPKLFVGEFWHNYPFFLPCAVSCCLTLCSITLGFFFLEETLPSKIKAKKTGFSHSRSSSEGQWLLPEGEAKAEPPPSIMSLLRSPVVRSVIFAYFMLSMQGTGFDVLFALVAFTSIKTGGLSRKPSEIGFALAFGGLFAACMQPFVFPALTRRFKLSKLYPVLMSLFPVVYALFPVLHIIARAGVAPGTDDMLTKLGAFRLWTFIAVLQIAIRIAGMSYATNMIFVKHAAPSRAALGSTFGVAQTCACIARGVSPAFVSSVFALTIQTHLLGDLFVWVVMVAIGIVGIYAAAHVRDGVAERVADECSS